MATEVFTEVNKNIKFLSFKGYHLPPQRKRVPHDEPYQAHLDTSYFYYLELKNGTHLGTWKTGQHLENFGIVRRKSDQNLK